MATNEDNDEAEQLRFLALKSMVRRSKQHNSNNDPDDQDIKLLRAAALKTITHKSNAQNNSLVINKDDKLLKRHIVNEKKRSISGQLSSSRNKKNKKLIENSSTDSKDFTSNSNTQKSSEEFKYEYEPDYKRKIKLEYTESQIKPKVEYIAKSESKPPINDSKDDVKKIIRNGSMQLSNLDSEKVDETMVLHITFSSSESDDSSSDCDTIQKEVTQEMEYNNVINQLVPVKKTVDVKPTDSISLEDNKYEFEVIIF